MSTYTQILYQIVFSTKYRKPSIELNSIHRLNLFIKQLLENKKCHAYIVNGTRDHIHIITHLHPTVSLSSLVKDIKVSSRKFIKEFDLFPKFGGWQNGYAAFTYDQSSKENLISYVANQIEHHEKVNYKKELSLMLKRHDVLYDPNYFPEKE